MTSINLLFSDANSGWVRSRDFLDTLNTLGKCIAYMEAHVDTQREARVYLERYKHLLTRALGLVRNCFVGRIRALVNEIHAQKALRQKKAAAAGGGMGVSETAITALLYAEFRDAKMKRLVKEVEKRAIPTLKDETTTAAAAAATASIDQHSDAETEYTPLLYDLYSAYTNARASLVVPTIQACLASIAAQPTSTNLTNFAQDCISYVRGVCLDEYNLWNQWFDVGRLSPRLPYPITQAMPQGHTHIHTKAVATGVYELLETLCEPLFYDALRPRVIREKELAKLYEVCRIMEERYFFADAFMGADGDGDGDGDANSDEETETGFLKLPTPQLDFEVLIRPIFEDVQTRLVFRTEVLNQHVDVPHGNTTKETSSGLASTTNM